MTTQKNSDPFRDNFVRMFLDAGATTEQAESLADDWVNAARGAAERLKREQEWAPCSPLCSDSRSDCRPGYCVDAANGQ